MLLGGLNAELQSIVMRYTWYTQQKQTIDQMYADIFMSESTEQKREAN